MITLVKVGEQTNVAVNHYVGLHKDKKPIDNKVPNGSEFFEMDTLHNFIYDAENNKWCKMYEDEEAKVSSQENLIANIASGADIDLTESFALNPAKKERADRMVFEKSAVVDFKDKQITVPSTLNTEDTKNWCALYVEVGATVYVYGDEGGIAVSGDVSPQKDGPYCLTNFGGELHVMSGHFKANGCAVYGYEGTTYIEGGFFDASPIEANGEIRPWTLNLLNSAYKEGKAKFVVRGGTFVNFDPSHPNTDDASSYVEKGREVVQEQKENGDIWYTVV